MQFHSRADWGADSPDDRDDIGDVHGCTIHWNGPSVGKLDHRECDNTMRGFQRYHMGTRGWSDIGYNLVVCQHGHVYEGRGLGVQGAHAEALNDNWYGIQAMVGEGDDLPDALFDGLRDAIDYCRSHGAGSGINAHRDADATSCPGDELYRWAHGSPMAGDTQGDVDNVEWFTIDRGNSEGKWRHATEVVQAILNTAEREPGQQENIAVDGYFGPITESRVQEYQRWANITVDGIVGPVTYTHLLYANIRGSQAPGWG